MSTNRQDPLHAVVTGGSGALGTAVVARLLEDGFVCHVPCFDDAEADRFSLAEHENVRLTRGIDLSDESVVQSYYADIPSLWSSIHCAGGFAMAPIADVGGDAWDGQMRLNARTCFLCCREAVVAIRRSGGGGRIVNVAARPAVEPRLGAGMIAYTMSKAAVAALTQALGEELAGEDIWVNAVAPSILDTPVNRDAMPDADHESWPALDDVASTIAFLASSANRTTRSAVVPVYGRV